MRGSPSRRPDMPSASRTPERNRHVHVEPASANSADRTLEKTADRRRPRQAMRSAPTANGDRSRVSGEISVLLPDQTDTDSSMMFIAAKPATERATHQPARLRCLVRFGGLCPERMTAIPQSIEEREDVPEPWGGAIPNDRQAAVGEVEPRSRDARQFLKGGFNARNARAARHAIDRKLDFSAAVVARSGVGGEIQNFGHDRHRRMIRLRDRNTRSPSRSISSTTFHWPLSA